jgi:hypothetical protein
MDRILEEAIAAAEGTLDALNEGRPKISDAAAAHRTGADRDTNYGPPRGRTKRLRTSPARGYVAKIRNQRRARGIDGNRVSAIRARHLSR